MLEQADILAIRAAACLLTARLHGEDDIFALQAGEPGTKAVSEGESRRVVFLSLRYGEKWC